MSHVQIIIHDAHIYRTKTKPVSVAEHSALLMRLSDGKCYLIAEMEEFLEEAGFQDVSTG